MAIMQNHSTSQGNLILGKTLHTSPTQVLASIYTRFAERYIISKTHPSATEVSSLSPHSRTTPDNGTHSVASRLSSGLHLFGRSAYAERTAEAILSSRESILVLAVGCGGCIKVAQELQIRPVWVSHRNS